MPADRANSLKADEEDRKTDHAPLVAKTENEEAATLTAAFETNLQQGDFKTRVDGMKDDLTETETLSNEALSEWKEERQKSRADELKSRSLQWKSSPQTMRKCLWSCDSMDGFAQSRGCGWLAKVQATAPVRAHNSPFLCSTDQGVQHVCTKFHPPRCLELCITDNGP